MLRCVCSSAVCVVCMRSGISLLLGRPSKSLFLSFNRAIPHRHIEVERLLRDYRSQDQVGIHIHKWRMCRQNGEREGGLVCSTSVHGNDTGKKSRLTTEDST